MGLFTDALKFPFHPFKRMWWFWLTAIPILGWIMFAGYLADIIRNLILHEKAMLPPMGDGWETFKTGFCFVVISAIFGFIAELFLWIPRFGWVLLAITMLLTPILLMQYALSRRFGDGFNVISAGSIICRHFLKYIWYNILIIGNIIVWAVASIPIITVLITIPASTLGTTYILAEFYRETMPAREPTKAHKKHR